MNTGAIVQKILEVSTLTQAELGVKVGVSQGTISKWITGEHSPNTEQWVRVVTFANRFPALRDVVKSGVVGTAVAIMGYVEAGGIVTPALEHVPPDGIEQVDIQFDAPADTIAYMVKGDAMRPAYRDGDVILIWQKQRGAAESYFNEEVAVQTLKGERYLREIQPGERRGTYNLSSHSAPVVNNVRLEWVGEIYLTIKASQVRRLSKSPADKRKN